MASYAQNPAATYVAPAGSATYEIGSLQAHPAQTRIYTVIDASQAPYGAATNNTVTFDGRYRVKGNLRLINGTFKLNPGTVFYVDGYSQYGGEIDQILIEVTNGQLYLTGATMQATCNEMWGGVTAGSQGSLYATSSGSRRTVIRDTKFGVSRFADYAPFYNQPPLNSHFYVENTDFINNIAGIHDGLRTGTYAQSDYVRNCNFLTDQSVSPLSLASLINAGSPYTATGIVLDDYWEHFGNNGGTPLQITNCTFDRLQVGIFGRLIIY